MKRKIVAIILATVLTASALTACGSSNNSSSSSTQASSSTSETPTPTATPTATPKPTETATPTPTEEPTPTVTIDMDKCVEDLKANLPLDPDYTFVRDYYIGLKDDTITITAVVDDATDPERALDFADTLVRQLNLYASMQDETIEPCSKDFYGGLYKRYDALVGVSPASKTDVQSDWFVFDAISGGKTMLKLNKKYR